MDRPQLSQAIDRLSGGKQNATIDYNLYDKSLRILDNAFVATYGYEPTQLLYARSDEDGHKVPRVTFPENMNCDETANLDLLSLQSESDTQDMESIVEQRQTMTNAEIKIAILDIIATIAPDEDISDLSMTERLREQIELDSMDFLDIVMELRKRYGVQVPEEEYQELATLQGCVDYLAPKLKGKELVTAG